MAALSQTLLDRLIEQVMPLFVISRWNCSLVYWLSWSEWCSKASGFLRRQIAMMRASVTRCAVMFVFPSNRQQLKRLSKTYGSIPFINSSNALGFD